MKVVAITGLREAGLVERPVPEPTDEFAVVRIEVAPLCTEYKTYQKGARSECLGHEAVGRVEHTSGSGRLRAGDRVLVMPTYPCGRCALCEAGDFIYCRNPIRVPRQTGSTTGTATLAQYVLKQEWLLVPIPDEMSWEHAALGCCGLGPTFGAMERLDVGERDTILITGMGAVGLGGVINAMARGARVIGVEGSPYRKELALALGAHTVLDPGEANVLEQILTLTDGLGVDKAIDCSGVEAAQRLMIDGVRRRGQVAFVGEAGDLTVHVSRDLLRKGITLHGCWHYNLSSVPQIFDVIFRSSELIDLFITHRFPMSRIKDAWELQINGQCGKVLIDPWA